MDLNVDGCARALPDVFGPCPPPKGNATTLADKLASHHLVMVKTFRPHAPRFYGASWTSRIYHIAAPATTLPWLRSAFVEYSAGDTLQLIVPRVCAIASLARRGHRPIKVFLGVVLF